MSACDKTVLIVDVNAEVANALALLFESYAFRALCAHDAAEATAAARRRLPDLVVMDLDMPGEMACRVARLMRALPCARPMLMIALSGWGDQISRTKSGAAGFDAHFAKPIDFKALRAYLSALE